MKEKPNRATLSGSRYLALRALARDTNRPTDELLHFYVLEGFLARLAKSSYQDQLILKGGVLLAAFDVRRPTKDIDLFAIGISNDADVMREIVRSIVSEEIEDGLEFDVENITTRSIRDHDVYSGIRISLRANLSTARVAFHVDINVGDRVWPSPQPINLPRVLASEPIKVSGYSLSMLLAEKIVTAVQRGSANTRWRDFADVFLLSTAQSVDGAELQRSVVEVAAFRSTPLSPLRATLAGFADIAQSQWKAWRRKQRLEQCLPTEFADVLERLIAFADPVIQQGVAGVRWEPRLAAWKTAFSSNL